MKTRLWRGLTLACVLTLALSTTAVAVTTTQDLDDGLTPDDLAQQLAGAGVTISNVTYTGANVSAGTFTEDTGIFSFDSGVVLSSGFVDDLPGPNSSDSLSQDTGTGGDPDLSALSGFPTFNAAVLEFDFVPDADELFISYVFASEEYNEFANSSFNDVFAFFVNGVNCAVTDTGDPVSVNTINGGDPLGVGAQNPSLYINNDPSDGGTIDIEPDGMTVTLVCDAAVNSGVTNTMKLAIADASDSAWDSWVLLSAGGITTTPPEICDDGIDNDKDGLVDGDDPDCAGEPDPSAITVTKYYDANANGAQDDGEPGIADWPVTIQGAGDPIATMTGEGGVVTTEVDAGDYAVTEGTGDGWMAVTPATVDVTVMEEETVEVGFGNLCLGPGGGHTKGYWQNRNGAADFEDIDDALGLLAALPLEDADGAAFDPGSYQDFRSWIRKANAKTPSYMLSAQLAAMSLNVASGHVSGDAIVYAPDAPSANAYGYTTIDALVADAISSLEAGEDDLALSRALDHANSNMSFVQAGPDACPDPFAIEQ